MLYYILLKPEERLVAVEAESGQKEVASWVYWIPTTGNCVKVNGFNSIWPGTLFPLNTCAAFIWGDDIPSPMNINTYFGSITLEISYALTLSVEPWANSVIAKATNKTDKTIFFTFILLFKIGIVLHSFVKAK